jgi:hypothetical protein
MESRKYKGHFAREERGANIRVFDYPDALAPIENRPDLDMPALSISGPDPLQTKTPRQTPPKFCGAAGCSRGLMVLFFGYTGEG